MATINVSVPTSKSLNLQSSSLLGVSLGGSEEIFSENHPASDAPEYFFEHQFAFNQVDQYLLNTLVSQCLRLRVLSNETQSKSKGGKSTPLRSLYETSISLSSLINNVPISQWVELDGEAGLFVEVSLIEPDNLDPNHGQWKSVEMTTCHVTNLPARVSDDQKDGSFVYSLEFSLPINANQELSYDFPLVYSKETQSLELPSSQSFYMSEEAFDCLLTSAVRNSQWPVTINRNNSLKKGSGEDPMSIIYKGKAIIDLSRLVKPGQDLFELSATFSTDNDDPQSLLFNIKSSNKKINLLNDENEGNPYRECDTTLILTFKFSEPFVPEKLELPPPNKSVSDLLGLKVSESEVMKSELNELELEFKSLIKEVINFTMNEIASVDSGEISDEESFQELRSAVLYNINSSGKILPIMNQLIESATSLAVKNNLTKEPIAINVYEYLLNLANAQLNVLSSRKEENDANVFELYKNIIFDFIFLEDFSKAIHFNEKLCGFQDNSLSFLLLSIAHSLNQNLPDSQEMLNKSLELNISHAGLALNSLFALNKSDFSHAETWLLHLFNDSVTVSKEVKVNVDCDSWNLIPFVFTNSKEIIPLLCVSLLIITCELCGNSKKMAQYQILYNQLCPNYTLIPTLNTVSKDVSLLSSPHLVVSLFACSMGFYNFAELIVKGELNLRGPTSVSLSLLGFIYFNLDSISEAEDQLNLASEIDSEKSFIYHYMCALIQMKKSIKEESLISDTIHSFKQCLKYEDAVLNPYIFHSLSSIFLDESSNETWSPYDACTILTEAVQIFPHFPSFWSSLAWSWLCLEKPEDAELAVRKAIEMFPFDPNSYAIYAKICIVDSSAAKQSLAMQLTNEALRLELNNIKLLRSLGDSFLENGNFDYALPLLRRAFSMEATSTLSFSIGKCFSALGRFEDALTYFEKALQLGCSDDNLAKQIHEESHNVKELLGI
ncbi:hypothetical protein P9112_012572 [Eukaryota sp. TZLM1-RC]